MKRTYHGLVSPVQIALSNDSYGRIVLVVLTAEKQCYELTRVGEEDWTEPKLLDMSITVTREPVDE